ncbi:hypothetical protein AB1N83_003309 [Pleurotus pulmonarius]
MPASAPSFDLYPPFFAGVSLSLALYGTAFAQSIHYFRKYPNDKAYLKFVVGSLVILQTMHSVCASMSIMEFKPLLGLNSVVAIPRTLMISEFPAYIAMSVVQFAYSCRVWHLSRRNKLLISTVALFSVSQLACGITLACDILQAGQLNSGLVFFAKQNVILRTTQLCSSMACDILIACSLVYFLQISQHTSLSGTRYLIRNLIVVSFSVGLVTCLFCLLTLITWFASKTTIWSTFHLLTGSCYINSFLVSLNSRNMLRERRLRWNDSADGVNTFGDYTLTDLRRRLE